MSDIVTVRRRASSLETSPQFDSYSKVVIHVDDENVATAGNDTGRTLEIDNPWGTQQMAEDILAKLHGYQYQPYTADGALLDPSAEIGDGVTVGNIYGGIYQRHVSFSRMMAATISAPHDEEIDHEFQFEAPADRKFYREIGDVRATLRLQSDQIEAKVEQENNNQSFGWKLLSDRWSVIANGKEVFKVDQSGGTFAGRVVASEGQIGGFTISATAIYNNISKFGGSQSSGVYIGPDGIQLGQNFKVNSSGVVTATNMTLSGTLNVGGQNISAAVLRSGAQSAYSNGSYWTGGSGYGYNYNNATDRYSGSYPSYFRATTLVGSTSLIASNSFTLRGYGVGLKSKLVKDSDGDTIQIQYLSWGG